MAKARTSAFFCKECGYESAKWMGQCPACKAWNSMVEEPIAKAAGPSVSAKKMRAGVRPAYLKDISIDDSDRYRTGFTELDRVLGGGVVGGSLVLVGGDPGIGKSTLLLQVCRNLAADGKRVLYISGEESLKQIKMRAMRIGDISGELRFLCETNMETIVPLAQEDKPDVMIIDSIQTMYCEAVASAAGSVSQVREVTNLLMQTAKGYGIATFIVGHVTKEGQVAGPRVLEHMVDTVLYFEGDRNASYRILRAVKNRFGSTNEIGVFEMRQEGLAQVPNPSEYLLSERPEHSSGAAVTCLIEGTRPLLIEVQALVNKTNFGLPRRTAVGTDYNRVNLLMAVLQKRCRIPMSDYDAYVNIAGGVRMNEPAMDLAIVAAIVSSFKDRPIDEKTIIFGEVGLSGEIRSVSMASQRVKEASRLGFERCILPKSTLAKLNLDGTIKCNCVGVASIGEMINEIL